MEQNTHLKSDINIQDIIQIAREAGELILEVYAREDLFVELKKDDSPLTLADRKSHEHIKARLNELYPDIPLVSEEQRNLPYQERKDWPVYWLVDPLDGTKEFIKRNGEFTVNIALIRNRRSVLGVVHVPWKKVLYFAEKGKGAFKIDEEGKESRISAVSEIPEKKIHVVASRSHLSEMVVKYVEKLKKDFDEVEYVAAGSALKFGLIAEGKAHVYPRLAPTMEWDTGAGQIVVEEACGLVIQADSGEPMIYNKESLVNPYFIVYGCEELRKY